MKIIEGNREEIKDLTRKLCDVYLKLPDSALRTVLINVSTKIWRALKNISKGDHLDFLKEDIKTSVFDADPDILLKCVDCGNDEHFTVFINELDLILEKGSNKILGLQEETNIAKPDTIVFICNTCKKVILESYI